MAAVQRGTVNLACENRFVAEFEAQGNFAKYDDLESLGLYNYSRKQDNICGVEGCYFPLFIYC